MLAATLFLAVAGCETPPPQAKKVPEVMAPLPTAEIMAKHSGKTIYARYPTTGGYYTEFHSPDGRVSIIEQDGSVHYGTWDVDNSDICYTYPTMNQGEPYCFEVRSAEGVLAHFFTSGPNTGEPAAIVIGAVDGNETGVPVK